MSREAPCSERVKPRWESRKEDLELFMAGTDPEHDTQSFLQYALSFDYVPPLTWADQPVGFWRYQISWGGPSDEIRFWSKDEGTNVRATNRI